MSAALKLTAVTRVHGQCPALVHALGGVDLTVQEGELVAVMGPSGSGKSTLLNVAGGLDSVTSGTVLVGGRDVTAMDARRRAEVRRRDVGYVFQDLNLIPTLTALENVALPLELDGVGVTAARQQAFGALDAVGLESVHDQFPEDLSGGQQQRVAIARAMVGPRRLVLADEPTGALDSVTGEAVMRLLRDQVDAGAAGLLVTHDARYAAWADRTIHLRDGEIIGTDTGSRTGDPVGEPADLMEADA